MEEDEEVFHFDMSNEVVGEKTHIVLWNVRRDSVPWRDGISGSPGNREYYRGPGFPETRNEYFNDTPDLLVTYERFTPYTDLESYTSLSTTSTTTIHSHPGFKSESNSRGTSVVCDVLNENIITNRYTMRGPLTVSTKEFLFQWRIQDRVTGWTYIIFNLYWMKLPVFIFWESSPHNVWTQWGK